MQNFTSILPNENVTDIVGIHESGKTNDDVRKLNIYKQRCEFLPRGFHKFFPNLEGLRIAESELVSLTQYDLRVFPKLRNCDMFNNRLTIMDSEIFSENPALEYLYFGDNSLYKIGYDLLRPLKNLSKAIFQGNSCTRKNANYANEIERLQNAINNECSSNESRFHKNHELKLKKLEELRKDDAQRFERLEKENQNLEKINNEDEDRIKELENMINEQVEAPSSYTSLWMLLILIILIAASSSIIWYIMKYKPHLITKRIKNGNNTEDTERFFQPFNDMTNGIHENGETNLSFAAQTPSVLNYQEHRQQEVL